MPIGWLDAKQLYINILACLEYLPLFNQKY